MLPAGLEWAIDISVGTCTFFPGGEMRGASSALPDLREKRFKHTIKKVLHEVNRLGPCSIGKPMDRRQAGVKVGDLSSSFISCAALEKPVDQI
jgi:hypothetical protein